MIGILQVCVAVNEHIKKINLWMSWYGVGVLKLSHPDKARLLSTKRQPREHSLAPTRSSIASNRDHGSHSEKLECFLCVDSR